MNIHITGQGKLIIEAKEGTSDTYALLHWLNDNPDIAKYFVDSEVISVYGLGLTSNEGEKDVKRKEEKQVETKKETVAEEGTPKTETVGVPVETVPVEESVTPIVEETIPPVTRTQASNVSVANDDRDTAVKILKEFDIPFKKGTRTATLIKMVSQARKYTELGLDPKTGEPLNKVEDTILPEELPEAAPEMNKEILDGKLKELVAALNGFGELPFNVVKKHLGHLKISTLNSIEMTTTYVLVDTILKSKDPVMAANDYMKEEN